MRTNITTGFILTVEKTSKEEKNAPPIVVCPRQLGEHIISFVEKQLTAQEQITIRLSVENWDEIYKVEEYMLEVSNKTVAIGNKDFSTNHWI